MKAMHGPPGQHEMLLTNGSNHTFEVHLSRHPSTPVSVLIRKQSSRQKQMDADYCLKQTLLCFCSLQSLRMYLYNGIAVACRWYASCCWTVEITF